MTARRTPRATGLEVVVSSGERIRLTGRRAEILAYLAAEIAGRAQLADLEVWQLEVSVTRERIVCRFAETGTAWRFRTEHTA